MNNTLAIKMTKPEKQLIKTYGQTTSDYASNLFLHKNGTFTPASSADHISLCKIAGTTLCKYLQAGGVRIKVHRDILAVESLKPITELQRQAVLKIVRSKNFAEVVIAVGDKYEVIEHFGKRITGRSLKGKL